MIKRSPSLTDQVKSHIKQQILANVFNDDRVPAEVDLASELGVSRTTVRDALSRLENEGVIYRKQGAGTFVNRPGLQIRSRLEEIWSYEDALEAHGYQPSTHLIETYIEPANAAVAAGLNIAAGEPMLVVHKLFHEDNQPVILTHNFIPQKLIRKPYTNEALVSPVFEFLSEYGDQHLSYYLSDIVPILAQGSLAARLQVPPSTALISFEEIGYNEENEPILQSFSYFRDDLLRLRLIRRKV